MFLWFSHQVIPLFWIHQQPICGISRKHSINIHTYAGSSQLYSPFEASAGMCHNLVVIDRGGEGAVPEKAKCGWKKTTFNLGDEKPKYWPSLLTISVSDYNEQPPRSVVQVCKFTATPVIVVLSLAAISLFLRIRTACRASLTRLIYPSSIRVALTSESLEKVIRASGTSRRDYCTRSSVRRSTV